MKKLIILLSFVVLAIPHMARCADENVDQYLELIEKSIKSMKNNPEISLRLIGQAIELHPDLGPAYLIKGIIHHISENDFIQAGKEFKKGILLMPDEEIKSVFVNLVERSISEFKTEKEQSYYQKAFSEIENNNPIAAVKNIELALKENRYNYLLYYEIGYAYIELRNFDKAIQYLEQGRQINPISRKILAELRYCYSELGKIKELASVVADISRFYGENPKINQELAYAYIKKDMESLAIITLQSNIEKYPEFLPSYYAISQIYYNNNQCKKAMPFLSHFIENSEMMKGIQAKSNVKIENIIKIAKLMHNKCSKDTLKRTEK